MLVINFIGNIFFVTCIYKLRNIKSEFNIRVEMLLTFLAWFILTQLSLGLFIHQSATMPTFDWLYLLLILRSIVCTILTCGRPLYLSYNTSSSNQFILLPPNQESIESLDMVL